MDCYDLLVVGGGINGAGIARDAAGRGLRVLLVEKDDLASHTSSWSTKLIHGGLRYLEHYEFRLVREALQEREVLLRNAPHLVSPLRFILPHAKHLRPEMMIRAGLFLYDRLGGRMSLEGSGRMDLADGPLLPRYTAGFRYSDCRVDDSRLVVENALGAKEHGATILTRTAFKGATRRGARWHAEIGADGHQVQAKAIVNAAGPWVTDLFSGIGDAKPAKRLRLVKGSHLIVRRFYEGAHAYILQNEDGRIVFTIPYLFGLTLVGTTDEPYEGPPEQAAISDAETDYLFRTLKDYFERPPGPDDVVSSYSGVRPLYDDLSAKDASAVTRDYAFDIDRGPSGKGAPLLSVYGGKLTTYRRLAEHALGKLGRDVPMGPAWTKTAPLPGGEGPAPDASFLPEKQAARLRSAYGARLARLLGDAKNAADLGEDFGFGLTAREADFLIETEWARSAADILDRRSKLGLMVSEAQRQRLEAYVKSRL